MCDFAVCSSEAYKKYKSKDAYKVTGVANIQKEIMTNGPVEVGFTVYGDFMKYKSGTAPSHLPAVVLRWSPNGAHFEVCGE